MNKENPSIILAVDTAHSETKIALIKNKDIFETSWKSTNNESEKILPAIEKLLSKNKCSLEDINKVIVIKGPGSFTGLRIGVALCNTISYFNKCDIIGIDTFVYHEIKEAVDLKKSSSHALLVFAGEGGVYLKDNSGRIEMLNLLEVKEKLNKKKIKNIFGYLSAKQKKFFKEFKYIENKKSFGKTIAEIDKMNFKNDKIVKPLYIKNPQITKSKKCYI
ncbi:MAG: tRNA (adenosine(37)-N6)-threonylcarbamoyltransferase complex dimerization subunit type 1 TsaB [Candidatus Gracilibacteria bacterium]|jgi:tRNA threonylcarbamoyl adenosine modification protein YeaZ